MSFGLPSNDMSVRNYGFSWTLETAHQSPDDWQFGALSQPCIASIPEADREKYLPNGELQYSVHADFMDCASRGPVNILEAKFNYLYQTDKLLPSNRKWLEDKGYVHNGRVLFSDRFIAIRSGTTRQGNSIKAPIDAVHTYGLIPKTMLPSGNMTFDEYHSGVTREMEKLGEEFLDRFKINYERVYAVHFDQLYKDDFCVLALHAWPSPIDGVYPKTDLPPNHVVIGFRHPIHTVFDNYLDVDADFVKRLAPDYKVFETGYRVFISREVDAAQIISLYQKVLNILRAIIKL